MFASAMTNLTWNNAKSLATPDKSGEYHGRIALFFHTIRGISDSDLEKNMIKAVDENLIDAIILAFNIRDCRGGKGERDNGRRLFKWLMLNHSVSFKKVFHLIPEYGRWDDLLFLLKVQGETDTILEFISSQLNKDKELMVEGKPISICAKWCPTEGDSDDRKYNLVDMICKHMKITPKKYRTEYTTPLRSYLNIVERLMCSGKWEDIDLSKVPSCAIKRLKKAFEKHIPDIFNDWKSGLAEGKTTVKAKQLFPYEIIKEIRENYGAHNEVLEAQWNVLEDELRKKGILENSVVVVDMSESMSSPNYLPIDNAIALGLIISSVVTGEFHNNVISFADNPKFLKLEEGTVASKYRKIKQLEVGYSTDIQKVFDLILEGGKKAGLTNSQMPKKIWIISDMQFNDNSIKGGSTNFEEINDKYNKSNFTRPDIVFWNVNGKITDYPVSVDDNGTCLISGFSPSIIKSILNTTDFLSIDILRTELDSDRYTKIKLALNV